MYTDERDLKQKVDNMLNTIIEPLIEKKLKQVITDTHTQT